MIEDDVFEYYSDAMEESLFQKGEIYYYASVYWVDEKCEYYDVVDGWKEGTIAQAGTLKSSKEFAISKNLLVFERDVFEFHFDFRNENEIKEEMIKRGRNIFSNSKKYQRENFISSYQASFKNEEKLFNDIIEELNEEF